MKVIVTTQAALLNQKMVLILSSFSTKNAAKIRFLPISSHGLGSMARNLEALLIEKKEYLRNYK